VRQLFFGLFAGNSDNKPARKRGHQAKDEATRSTLDEIDRLVGKAVQDWEARQRDAEEQSQGVTSPTPAVEAQAETTSKPPTSPPTKVFELGPRQRADGGFAPCCGTRVLVHGTLAGRVAYAGPVHYAEGDYFGVVLDEPKGKNNGTIRGMQYFSCRPKHGLMVKVSELQPL
jgi:dynactin 1